MTAKGGLFIGGAEPGGVSVLITPLAYFVKENTHTSLRNIRLGFLVHTVLVQFLTAAATPFGETPAFYGPEGSLRPKSVIVKSWTKHCVPHVPAAWNGIHVVCLKKARQGSASPSRQSGRGSLLERSPLGERFAASRRKTAAKTNIPYLTIIDNNTCNWFMILDTREKEDFHGSSSLQVNFHGGASGQFGTPLFFHFLELSGGEGRAGVDRRRARPASAAGSRSSGW